MTRSEPPRALLDSDVERIAEALRAVLADHTPPVRPLAPSSGDHPLKESLQRGIRKLQADIHRRANLPPIASGPPKRPSATPAVSGPAGWQVLSPGTSRASASLVDALHRADPAALTTACALTEPIALRFSYRWVRAHYAADDHGKTTAIATSGGAEVQRVCLLAQLTQAGLLGPRNLGPRPFSLQARLTPSPKTSR